MTETVSIDRVGAEGDGIATATDGSTLYVPNTLPGEVVQIERLRRQGEGWLAYGVAVEHASDAREPAPCMHFGECGGCVLQHWRAVEYRAWKTEQLTAALRRAGCDDPQVAPIVVTPPRSRRRMDLAGNRTPHGVLLGLHARITSPASRGSAAKRTDARSPAMRARGQPPPPDICDLAECHVLHPALFDLVSPLRQLLPTLNSFRREASIIANRLDHGVDLLLRTDAAPDQTDRNKLIAFARSHRLLRISRAPMRGDPEPVAILQPPRVTLSNATVEPPPGAFLQATCEGEAAIVQAVLDGLPDKLPARGRIAELYAGCGTLTFALAQRGRVTAWEGDADAVSALRRAASHAGRIDAIQRDLARQPISAAELAGFAVVVLDPPFAGAAAQAAQIAAAKPPRVIYVSCNPAVLARDARMLHNAGYRLLSATPVDQFLWSARLESVCVFRL